MDISPATPAGSSSLALEPSSFSVLFNMIHPPEDHTFVPGAMGGKIPGFVYGQAQAGPSTNMNVNTNTNTNNEIPYDFDPTQFISALSSQLPQIENESPYDQGMSTVSGNSGPTPNLGEYSTKGKERAKDGGEGSKLVKVTWWRPHGAVSIPFDTLLRGTDVPQTAIAPGQSS